MTSYPITTHTRGTTYSRAGLYTLPSGTWTASAVVRKPDGTLIETLAVNFAALSTPDAAGNTHALSVLATAAQTALWPLAALLQDVLFTDASSTPVIVPAVTTIITVSAHTAPISEADNPLQTISPDLAPVLRGEQGPAGDAAAGAVTSVAGRTGAVTLDKADVGLGNVDNTADASKPVSTAQAAADAAVQAAAAADATSKATAAAAAAVAALGTAAALNVPATGDAAAGEVVKGTDSRLSDARTPTAHTQAASTISDSTAAGRAVLTATDAAAARTAIGAGTSSFDGAYASLSGKPTLGTAAATASTDYTPAAHVGAGGTAHANAVAAGAAGFMTGADKSKLDGIATGATVAPTTTDALTEGSTNIYHTAARVRAALLTGLSTATATVVNATHTVLEAIGFLQKQVSDNATAITAKQDALVSGTNIKTVNSTSLLGSGNISVTADLTAPGPIGGTTPNTIAGTYGTFSGGTRTASGSTLVITETLNNAAVAFPGAVIINQTHTASAAGTIAFDVQAAGVSKFNIIKTGAVSTPLILNGGAQGTPSLSVSTNRINTSHGLGSATDITWANGWSGLSGGNGSQAKMGQTVGGSGGLALMTGSTTQCDVYSTGTTYADLKLRSLISSGNLTTGISDKTTSYTLTANDGTVTADATGGAITLTLPAVSACAGRLYVLKRLNSGANAVTVAANAAETMDGSNTVTLSSQYATLILQGNAAGTAWHKLAVI